MKAKSAYKFSSRNEARGVVAQSGIIKWDEYRNRMHQQSQSVLSKEMSVRLILATKHTLQQQGKKWWYLLSSLSIFLSLL